MTSQKVLTGLFDNREKLNITNPDRKANIFLSFPVRTLYMRRKRPFFTFDRSGLVEEVIKSNFSS